MAVLDPPSDQAHANEEQSVRRTPLQQGLAVAERGAMDELELVRRSLAHAIEAVSTGDERSRDAVLAQAQESEQRYSMVHDDVMALVARQAPVAGDLRLAMALLHVNDRAERMSAQCVNIATMSAASQSGAAPKRQLECLSEMARLADEQIAAAKRIFEGRSADEVGSLRGHDQAINEHNRRCFSIAVEECKDPDCREAAMFVALMARAIERIGDNAVDIGQQAAFVETGRLRPPSGHRSSD